MSTALEQKQLTKGSSVRLMNVLLATDFSEAARAALNYAAAFARSNGGELHLLNVVPPEAFAYLPPEQIPATRAKLIAESERHMRELTPVVQMKCRDFETHVRCGDIENELRKIISRRDIDLVVVATAALHGVKRFFLGSVAEEIFRAADVPVLIIGPNVPRHILQPPDYRKILLCTELSPETKKPVEYAIELAKRHNGRVTLLHVGPKGLERKKEDYGLKQAYMEEMAELITSKPAGDYSVDLRLAFGEPSEKILDVANGWEADLIVLGTKHAGPLATHLMGGTAVRIISEAKCPVLAVPHLKELH